MFGVETDSFLPNNQSDGRDLACQGEARHRWLHASGNANLVELLERSGEGSGPGRGALKDIFQIVIMILVQAADGQELLATSELATHELVFPTAISLQRQAAVGPQLPLGTKTVWRLHQSNQQSGADRTNRGNLA